MELTLKRVIANNDGVFGVLCYGDKPLWLTLEEEDKNNSRGISCIPAGSYICKRITRPSGQLTYEVQNVPGRSAILIHPGNTEKDTEGCILIGKKLDYITAKDDDTEKEETQMAVLESNTAFNEFMKIMNDRMTFVLHVKWG